MSNISPGENTFENYVIAITKTITIAKISYISRRCKHENI
jgi:hypothetical protein